MTKEIRKCSKTRGCDKRLWEGNVEKTCLKSKRGLSIYGGKSVCEINRSHVRKVFGERIERYTYHYVVRESLRDFPIPHPEERVTVLVTKTNSQFA